MSKDRNLVSLYILLHKWTNVISKLDNSFIIKPYSYGDFNVFSICTKLSVKEIKEDAEKHLEYYKERFYKRQQEDENIYITIEREIKEIQQYFRNGKYIFEQDEVRLSYELEKLKADLEKGQYQGGHRLILVLFFSHVLYFKWLHQEKVSNITYFKFYLSSILGNKGKEKDIIIIREIMFSFRTAREIIQELKQYKQTLKGNDFYWEDVLDQARDIFLSVKIPQGISFNIHNNKTSNERASVFESIEKRLNKILLNPRKEVVKYVGVSPNKITKPYYFEWLEDLDKLKTLFNALIENELICRETSYSSFSKYFSQEHSKEEKEPIKWTATNPLLGYLFYQISIDTNCLSSDCEYASIIGHTKMFINTNNTILTRNNVKSSLSQSLKSGKPRGSEKIENIISSLKH